MNLKPDMAKLRELAKKIKTPLISSAAGVAAGSIVGGAVGHRIGKKKGAKRTAMSLATEFGKFNKIENQALAQHAYMAGLRDAAAMRKTSSLNKTESVLQEQTIQHKECVMNKVAYLDQIKGAAFEDELSKIAAGGSAKSVAAIKKLLASAKVRVGESLAATRDLPGSIIRQVKAMRASGPARNSALGRMMAADVRSEMLNNAMKASPVLALGGLGLGGAGLALSGGKKKKKD